MLVLGGCSIASFIPPLDIGDAFDLNNTPVTITLRRITVSPGGLDESPSSLASEGSGTNTKFFSGDPDIDLRNFGVGTFTLDLTTDISTSVTRPDDGFPEHFDITELDIRLEVIQEGGAERVSLTDSFEGQVRFSLDATSCDPDSEDEDETCRYRFDGTQSTLNEELKFELENQGAQANRLVQIIRQEGTHTVRVTLDATTQSTPELDGSELTLTLKHLSTTIKLR